MKLQNAADVVLICLDRTHPVPLISKESQRIINAYKSRGVSAVVNLSLRYPRAFIIEPPTAHIKTMHRVEESSVLKGLHVYLSQISCLDGLEENTHLLRWLAFWIGGLFIEKRKEDLHGWACPIARIDFKLIVFHLLSHLLWFQATALNQCVSEQVNWPTWLSLCLFVYLINLLYKH